MKKPRIALFHYTYPPVVGGVEIVIQQQAHLFAQRGFDTTVIVGKGFSRNPNIKLVVIPELQSLNNIQPGLREKILSEKIYPPQHHAFSNAIYKKLERVLKPIDICIMHNVTTNTFNPP